MTVSNKEFSTMDWNSRWVIHRGLNQNGMGPSLVPSSNCRRTYLWLEMLKGYMLEEKAIHARSREL